MTKLCVICIHCELFAASSAAAWKELHWGHIWPLQSQQWTASALCVNRAHKSKAASKICCSYGVVYVTVEKGQSQW